MPFRKAQGIVVFAHGSGSSRLSPRNTHVSRALNEAGLATLLFDLLLPEEAEDRRNVFDIPLLASRLEEALDWIRGEEALARLAVGLFGASTGAAAALTAAARRPDQVLAVVSRGGRPDLAAGALARVKAPTLLIVGGRDEVVIELNETALAELKCEKRLDIVPGATHLFRGTRHPRCGHIARNRLVRPILGKGSKSMRLKIFKDRKQAGQLLAEEVARHGYDDPVVLGLPRGGVPVAAEVAAKLKAPLDVILVRKIGAPMQPELAIGAVVDGDAPEIVRNEELIRELGLTDDEFQRGSRAAAQDHRGTPQVMGSGTPAGSREGQDGHHRRRWHRDGCNSAGLLARIEEARSEADRRRNTGRPVTGR